MESDTSVSGAATARSVVVNEHPEDLPSRLIHWHRKIAVWRTTSYIYYKA